MANPTIPFQGAKLILLIGNSRNSFIKEALKYYREGKDSYLTVLLNPAISSGHFSSEQLHNQAINSLADKITLWNLSESESRIIEQNQYIREEVSKGNIGLCSAFFNRKTGKVKFSPIV